METNMTKILYTLLISLVIPISSFSIDDTKSSIKWKGTKSTGSFHDGVISVNSSLLKIDNNKLIGGEIIIDMNSIICTDIKDEGSNNYLVKHLKNEDFFNTPMYPKAKLQINSVSLIENNDYKIEADLDIKNQTHPIIFTANIVINEGVGLASGYIEIDRSKYGIKYKSKSWFPDIGDRFINDTFELYFNLLSTEIN